MIALALSMTTLLLSACGTREVADRGCSWVRPLTLTDDEIIIFAANIIAMRPLTDQINSQNTTRTKECA